MKWEYKTVDWGEIRKIGSRVTGEDFIEANVDAGLNSLGQTDGNWWAFTLMAMLFTAPTKVKNCSPAAATSNTLSSVPTVRAKGFRRRAGGVLSRRPLRARRYLFP